MRIVWGTDGVRGLVGCDIDSVVANKVGNGLGAFLVDVVGMGEASGLCVLVGVDNRSSGQMIALGVMSGLLGRGIRCVFVGEIATSGLAYLCGVKGCFGVMVTASHNTGEYNGIKLFNKLGEKMSDYQTRTLESYCNGEYLLTACDGNCGEVVCKDWKKFYISFLRKHIESVEYSVVWDTANGVMSELLPLVVKNKIKNSHFINCDDPSAVNKECGATDTRSLVNAVVESGADVGFALDGDGDRLIAIDEKGKVVDGDVLLALFGKWYKIKHKCTKMTVIGTLMTNYGIEKYLNDNAINLVRTNVGDRFIWEEMKKNGFVLGGEQSGHIIYAPFLNTGDGVITAGLVLKIMKDSGKKLSELVSSIPVKAQVNVNVTVPAVKKKFIIESSELKNIVQKVEYELAFHGRVLVRASGTENVIRVLLEGENKKQITQLSAKIVEVIESLGSQNLVCMQ